MAISAINRKAQIDYYTVLTIVNAISVASGRIASAIAGSDFNGGDSLNKVIESLKELLLPQHKEEKEEKAKRAKELLAKEVSGGPIKVQVVGKERRDVRR